MTIVENPAGGYTVTADTDYKVGDWVYHIADNLSIQVARVAAIRIQLNPNNGIQITYRCQYGTNSSVHEWPASSIVATMEAATDTVKTRTTVGTSRLVN